MTLSFLIDITPKNYSKHVVVLSHVTKSCLYPTCFYIEKFVKFLMDSLWLSAFHAPPATPGSARNTRLNKKNLNSKFTCFVEALVIETTKYFIYHIIFMEN